VRVATTTHRPAELRVAIVHERLTELGGSEKVVEELHRIWPDAPVYAAVIDPAAVPNGLVDADIRPSRLQHRYHGGGYAHLLPLIPSAFAALDLTGFDLVVTSHHAFANRVRPPTGVPIVSYTYTPARWIWDAEKRRDEPVGRIGRLALAVFATMQRPPDRAAARRLRRVVAISRAVAQRVADHWGMSAAVVAPPVDVDRFSPAPVEREDFFLWVGRLVPYKAPVVAVEAARRAGVRLVVVGDGRMRTAVERVAGPNVEVLGPVDDAMLLDLYRRCRAFVMPGEEDFGIAAVEAQACGAPVVALAAGGALDTVVDGRTGVLYAPGRDPLGALAAELRDFDPTRYEPAAIRSHAEGFAPARFRRDFAAAVAHALEAR
jgi:glycosyltransferase involved in cell wall biosynthesis